MTESALVLLVAVREMFYYLLAWGGRVIGNGDQWSVIGIMNWNRDLCAYLMQCTQSSVAVIVNMVLEYSF